MKTTVIYHSADFDGLFCREIARKFLPDAELIGWDFGDKPLEVPAGMGNDGPRLYIMDLPIDQVFGFRWQGEDTSKSRTDSMTLGLSNLVWIDHHKSSIESHPKDIDGYRIDGVAACRLAWFYFNALKRYTKQTTTADFTWFHGHYPWAPKQDFVARKVSEPLAVRLAGEYDIWDKRDADAELFQHGLRSIPLTDGVWDELLETRLLSHLVDRILEKGLAVKYARDREYEEVIQKQGFDIEFEGLKFLACNSHELDIRSQLFAAAVKPHHDALLGFTFSGKDWRVSMYHAPGKEHHDLSQIAVKYGGGGHRGACGFRAKALPFTL